MKRFLWSVPLIASAVILSATGTAQAAATGDLWEVTTQMTMEGMPAGMGLPSQTRQACAAKEWTKPPVNNERNCEFSDFQSSPTKATWKMKCDGMSGEGEITRTKPDAYTGWMKMVAPQGAMTMNLSGRRVGDCDAGEAKKSMDAQVAQAQAQAEAGQRLANDATKKMCTMGAESLDLRTWRSYEELCTGPQGGLTVASYKAPLCAKAKSYEGHTVLCERKNDPENDLAGVAKFCGLDPAALTRTACTQAVKSNDLKVVAKCCPTEAQAIAKEHCAGRSYTSSGADPYAAFCLSYAKDMLR